MNARTAAILLAAAALTACAVPPDGPTQSVGEDYSNLLPQRDIYAVETFSGFTAGSGRRVLDQPSWKMMWDSITANFGAKKPTLPDVDFSTHVVLVAAAGSTPTQLVSFQIIFRSEDDVGRHRAEFRRQEADVARCGFLDARRAGRGRGLDADAARLVSDHLPI